MKGATTTAITILVFACSAFSAREVAFIGLTGTQAPAIEKTYNRHFLEHLAMMPDVRSLNTIELANLRERTSGNFDIVSMTPAFLASLKRFVSDTTLVIWGRVKECSVRPERFWLIGAGIRSNFIVELTVFNVSSGNYVFIGDVKSTSFTNKGLFLGGSVEKAVLISAQERSQLIDNIEIKNVASSGRILNTLLFSETSKKDKKTSWPSDSAKKAEKKIRNQIPPNEEPAVDEDIPAIEEDPADFDNLDTIDSLEVEAPAIDSTAQK